MGARHAMLLSGAALLGCTATSDGEHALGTAASAIVGGELSDASEDFVVFVSHEGDDNFACGATLVAPNLVLTAKHCVYMYAEGSESLCDATGEPQVGLPGGYTTGPYDLSRIQLFTGVDGRNRARLGEPAAATAVRIIDDGTQTLCSHDLAYVLLDRPITGAPIARLRLGKRPQPTDALALAGWGVLEHTTRTDNRYRRTDMAVERVGPPVPPKDPTGSLGPRTFETGPGGCRGDSGSPSFDPTSKAVVGVLARALQLDLSNPVSQCSPPTVSNVFMLVTDFDDVLRQAFTAANAQPWIEGRASAGFRAFGESCIGDVECGAGFCAPAGENGAGACNLRCSASVACPGTFSCDGQRCVPVSSVPGAGAASAAGADAGAAAATVGGGCSLVPPTTTRSPALAFLAGCLFMGARSMKRRRRLPRSSR